MLVKNGCVRCEGDLYLENGLDGTEFVCIQCGHRRTARLRQMSAPVGAAVPEKPARRARRKSAAPG